MGAGRVAVCVAACRGFLPWGVSISGYVQGCPLWGHTTPALAECKTLKLWHWGKRQAACLDFYFSCPLGFSCLLAHCQGLSAGRWVLCVPCLVWLIGTTSPFFQEGDHGQMIKEQSSELGVCTLYRHAESHSFLQVLPVTINISRQEMLGEEVTAVRPHVPLHFRAYFQTLCSQAGFFFFFEVQLFYENSCNYCSWQQRHVGKCPEEMPAP